MAKCYLCKKEIGWFDKKNRRGNRGYIFDCPYCGVESTESLVTNLAYILIAFLPLVLVILLSKKDLAKTLGVIVVWGIAYLPGSRFLWWKYAAKLSKPFKLRLFG